VPALRLKKLQMKMHMSNDQGNGVNAIDEARVSKG
jgi:hypothetical protein